jgi:hypothetical protein
MKSGADMRFVIAALAMAALPGMVAAQSTHVPSPPLGSPLPLPTLGFPLPTIGFPLAPIGLPMPTNARPSIDHPRVGKVPPSRDIDRRQHRRFGRTPGIPLVYVVPFDYRLPPQPATPPEPREARPLTGALRLEAEPADLLQIYVDGYYVGTPADFSREMELDAGPHVIELRAPGYETLQFDVNIAAGRSITYRGALKPTTVSPPAPPVVTRPDIAVQTPTTFYFIPGCYAGNVPPKDAGLPATCDQSRVTTFTRP